MIPKWNIGTVTPNVAHDGTSTILARGSPGVGSPFLKYLKKYFEKTTVYIL